MAKEAGRRTFAAQTRFRASDRLARAALAEEEGGEGAAPACNRLRSPALLVRFTRMRVRISYT